MSKIETPTVRGEQTSLCQMCGKQAKDVAEVNGHTICPRCFSGYIVDRIEKRYMKNGKTARIRNPQASSSRPKNRQIGAGDNTAVVIA